MGKPPRSSLPVLSAHSFTSNWQLAVLESAEEGNYCPQKNVSDVRIDRGTAACEADRLQTEVPCPGLNVIHQLTQTFMLL